MSDTFTTYQQSGPSAVPVLVRGVIAQMPKGFDGNVINPVLNDGAIRALLDALAALAP